MYKILTAQQKFHCKEKTDCRSQYTTNKRDIVQCSEIISDITINAIVIAA